MEKTLTVDPQAEPSAEEVTYYKNAIAEMFAEMDRMSLGMAATQAEIERLKMETRATMENVHRLLSQSWPAS